MNYHTGTFKVPRSFDIGIMPPLTGRMEVSLDVDWDIIESYNDGVPFVARRTTGKVPVLLINGTGMWRWHAHVGFLGHPDYGYQRLIEHIIEFGRKNLMSDVEVRPLQDEGRVGDVSEFIAVYKQKPSVTPVLKVTAPSKEVRRIYGGLSSISRFSFVPDNKGTYEIGLEKSGLEPIRYPVTSLPYDEAHPEARPELMIHIARSTGGRVLTPAHIETWVSGLGYSENVLRRVDEDRIVLARMPHFYALFILLFIVLWTYESRWFK